MSGKNFKERSLRVFIDPCLFTGIDWEHNQDTDFQRWKNKFLRTWTLEQSGRFPQRSSFSPKPAAPAKLLVCHRSPLSPLCDGSALRNGRQAEPKRLRRRLRGGEGCPAAPAGTPQPYSRPFMTNTQAEDHTNTETVSRTTERKTYHLFCVTLPTFHMPRFNPCFSRNLVSSTSTYLHDDVKPIPSVT